MKIRNLNVTLSLSKLFDGSQIANCDANVIKTLLDAFCANLGFTRLQQDCELVLEDLGL